MATGLLTSVGLVPVQLQIVVAAAVFTHFLALGPLETLIVHFFALFSVDTSSLACLVSLYASDISTDQHQL